MVVSPGWQWLGSCWAAVTGGKKERRGAASILRGGVRSLACTVFGIIQLAGVYCYLWGNKSGILNVTKNSSW